MQHTTASVGNTNHPGNIIIRMLIPMSSHTCHMKSQSLWVLHDLRIEAPWSALHGISCMLDNRQTILYVFQLVPDDSGLPTAQDTCRSLGSHHCKSTDQVSELHRLGKDAWERQLWSRTCLLHTAARVTRPSRMALEMYTTSLAHLRQAALILKFRSSQKGLTLSPASTTVFRYTPSHAQLHLAVGAYQSMQEGF